MGKPIGRGSSGLLLTATNPEYPNAILKPGPEWQLDQEAKKLWAVRHPNVAHLYGLVVCYERSEIYLAIKQEGPDLATLLGDPLHT